MTSARAFATCILGTLLVPLAASANDAAFWGQGATVFAVKESRVRMERERVKVRYVPPPADGKPIEARPVRWEADATFELRNETDAEITIQVGFPDWEDHSEVRREGPGPHWAIRDFRTEVDGKPVDAVHKVVARKADATSTGTDAIPQEVLDLGYGATWTWDVTFPPKGLVTVRNTYRFGGYNSNGPFEACAGDPPAPEAKRAFWRGAKPMRGGWAFGDGTCDRVEYIVTTGRTWGGPIGVADIEIEVLPGTPPHLFVPVPDATEVADGKVRWHFENWTPRREVAVLYSWPIPDDATHGLPAFDTAAQAKAWTRFARANRFAKAAVGQVIVWTKAARDLRLTDPVLTPFLTHFKWYMESFPPDKPASARQTRQIVDVLSKFAGTL